MEGTDASMGMLPEDHVTLTNEHFPHLSSHEWAALERMRAVIGEAAVIMLLRSASPDEQKTAAVNFMHHEIMSAQKQTATPASSFKTVPLKLYVSLYRGRENEPLARWFVELDAAVAARQLRDPSQQVLFAMSKLAGRAKSWAYGKRLADPNCFPSYDYFKVELKKAFEPPHSEFRARAEFLKLRQGQHDVHEYAQRASYLVSSIVEQPIDAATQVVTFLSGLNHGPVRNQLFREYPKTLDQAIEHAMQEEFSIKQAKIQGFPSRSPRTAVPSDDGPEPMDLSYVSTSGNVRPRGNGKCFRCGKPGHIARNCRVSLPGRQTTQGSCSSGRDRNNDRRFDEFPTVKKREQPVGAGLPTGPDKRTVDIVETQDSGPDVHVAHAVSTKSDGSVSQSSALIIHKVHVDGIVTPLRALVDTGASNNFVRAKVVIGSDVAPPDTTNEMAIRLANGSTVKIPKRVMRLAIEFEDFRGEDEFILLDLDDKFDLILGMPWLKRYQPRIDWMKMKISVDKSCIAADLNCVTTEEVIWAYASVDDASSEIQESDGPSISRDKPVTMNGGGAVRRQEKTVSFAKNDEELRSGVKIKDREKTDVKSFTSSGIPDQDASQDDEGGGPQRGTTHSYADVVVYGEEGDSMELRHIQVENPPSSVEDLVSLPVMNKKALRRSLAKGEISQLCAIVEAIDKDSVNAASAVDADALSGKTRKERFEEQSWDALKTNPVYELVREFEDIFPDKVPDELPFDRGIRHEIDVPPGTKYCITRQWPLPKEQVDAIDEFFAQRSVG